MAKISVGAYQRGEISEEDIKKAEMFKPSVNEISQIELKEKAIGLNHRSLGQGTLRLLAKLEFLEDQGKLPSQKK